MPRGKAAEFVAQQATQLVMRKKISARVADGYRDEVNKSPSTKRMFRMLLALRAASGCLPTSMTDAKAEVRAVLRRFAAATGID